MCSRFRQAVPFRHPLALALSGSDLLRNVWRSREPGMIGPAPADRPSPKLLSHPDRTQHFGQWMEQKAQQRRNTTQACHRPRSQVVKRIQMAFLAAQHWYCNG